MTLLTVFVGIVALVLLVDAINRRRTLGLRESGMLPPVGAGTDADVERLVRAGRRIDAIKLHREIHGIDLKEAKHAVDALARRIG